MSDRSATPRAARTASAPSRAVPGGAGKGKRARRRLHLYTKASLEAAMVAAFLNLIVLALRAARAWSLLPLAVDNVFGQFVAAMISGGLGLEVVRRHYWPGRTAIAVATRPGRTDMGLALGALGLTVLNLGVAVWAVGEI